MDLSQLKQNLSVLFADLQKIIESCLQIKKKAKREALFKRELTIVEQKANTYFSESGKTEEAILIFNEFLKNIDELKSQIYSLKLYLDELLLQVPGIIKACRMGCSPYDRKQRLIKELDRLSDLALSYCFEYGKSHNDNVLYEEFNRVLQQIKQKNVPLAKHGWNGFFITSATLMHNFPIELNKENDMDVSEFKGKLNELYKEAKMIADSEAIKSIGDIIQKRKQYQKKISDLNSQGKELFDVNNKLYNKEITDAYIEFCNQLNTLVTEFKRANPLEPDQLEPLLPELDEVIEKKPKNKKNRHSLFGGKEEDDVLWGADKSEPEKPLLENSI